MSLRLTRIVFGFAAILSLILAGCGGGSSGGGGGGGGGETIAPYVAVLSPNGGEVFSGSASDTVTITWDANDETALATDPISIAYSTNAGSTYTDIATGEANDGSYTWTLAADMDNNVLIRVTARDAAGNTASDVSDASFALDATAPTVDATAPAGNVTVSAGDSVPISWTTSDPNFGTTPMTLAYATDHVNGPWTTIATVADDASPYTWLVPGFGSTTNVFVRVTATDAAGNSANEKAPIDATPATITINQDLTAPTITASGYGTIGSTLTAFGSDLPQAPHMIVQFSETMNTTATSGAITLTNGAGSFLFDTYWAATSAPNDTIIIVGKSLLTENEAWTLSVTTGAADTAGNTLAAQADFNFTTIPDFTPPVCSDADTTVEANNLSLGVLPNAAEITAFNFEFNENTTITEFRLDSGFDGISSDDVDFTGNGTTDITVDIDWDGDGTSGEAGDDALTPGYGYVLELTVSDATGNTADYEWTFVVEPTASVPDAPYLLSSIPADEATDAACNMPLYLVFSETLDPTTITSGITVTGSTSGALTIDDYDIMSGNLVSLTIDGGLPGGETITVATTVNLEDAAGNPAAAAAVLTFDTGLADTNGPALYSSTISNDADEMVSDPIIMVNLNEMIRPASVDLNAVYIEDAATGAPIYSYGVDFDEESGELELENNSLFGASLATDRNYILHINGVEDLCGNASAITIPFSTDSGAGDTAPVIEDIELDFYLYPEWAVASGGSNSIVRLIQLSVTIADDINQTDATVTASDGTNSWILTHDSGGTYDYMTNYAVDGSETIITGSGAITVTVVDDATNTVAYKRNLFIPASLPQQTSPRNAVGVDIASAGVDLTWTTPGYADSVIAVVFSKEPDEPLDSDLPVLFVNASETSVTIPDDFGLDLGYYFWSLLFFRPGFDTNVTGLNFDMGMIDVFNVYDSSIGYTISGTVTQSSGTASGNVIIGVFNDGESFESGEPLQVLVMPSLGSYTLYSLLDGTYDIYAWRDVAGDMEPTGDPYAEIQDVVISGANETANIDLQFTPAELSVSNVAFSQTSVAANQDVLVSYTLNNTGTGDADSFNVAYWLSSDTVLGSDTFLGSVSITTLAASDTSDRGATINVGALSPASTWYLIVEVDSNDDVYETNESDNDNYSVIPVTIAASAQPDLVATIESFPATVSEGEIITMSVKVENQGTGASGSCVGQLYHSTSATLGAGTQTALYSPSKTIPGLVVGGSTTFTGTVEVAIPSGTGSRFLIWSADDTSSVAESVESNNAPSEGITVNAAPDIQAEGSTLPTLMTGYLEYVTRAGVAFDVTSSFGEGNTQDVVGGFDIGVYVSTDDPWIDEDTDTQVATYAYSATLTGGSTGNTQAISTTLPNYMAYLDWDLYIGCYVDENDEVFESDETDSSNGDDNTETVMINLLPEAIGAGDYDLAMDGIDLDDAASSGVGVGNDFAVYCEFRNAGDEFSGSFDIAIYLSDDMIFGDADDEQVGTLTTSLEDGDDYVLVTCTTGTFGSGASPYLYAEVDSGNAITETDENNNVQLYYNNLNIVPLAGLSPDLDNNSDGGGGGAGISAVVMDSAFSVSDSFKNGGSLEAGAFNVRVYASEDAAVADDIEIGSKAYTGAPVGWRNSIGMTASYVSCTLASADVTTQWGTPPANVYLYYVVDADGDITEGAEGNNTKWITDDVGAPDAIALASSGANPDLAVIMYMEDDDEGPGVPNPPTFHVAQNATNVDWYGLIPVNFGTAAAAATTVDFFLETAVGASADPDNADHLTSAGAVAIPALGANEYTMTLNVDANMDFTGIAAGSYELYAYIDYVNADADGLIPELLENNNDSANLPMFGVPIPLEIHSSTAAPEFAGKVFVDNDSYVSRYMYLEMQVFNTALDATADSSAVTAWFSADASVTTIAKGTGDIALATADVPVLPGGHQAWTDFDIFAPASSHTTGSYYALKIELDALSEVTELDELDNTVMFYYQALRSDTFDSSLTWTAADLSGGGTGNVWTNTGNAAVVDSTGSPEAVDSTLTSPQFNCSDAALEEVVLFFEYDMTSFTGSETFQVEVYNGSAWQLAADQDDFWGGSGQAVIDISSYHAGYNLAQVRISFQSPANEGSLEIDEIVIIGAGLTQ